MGDTPLAGPLTNQRIDESTNRRPSLTHLTQYLALRLAAMGLHIFDIDDNLAGARALGSLMYRFDHEHRQRATDNITRAMPDLSTAQVQQLARKSLQHFLQLGVEVMFTPRLIHLDNWPQHVTLHNLGPALDLMLSGRPTIVVTSHFGNWELLGYLLATVGLDMDAVARPIDNPLINRWLLDVRERRGIRIITKFGATDRMTSVLDAGGTLAFIGDQNAGAKGLFVPFFGRLASAYKSIGLLALHYNAPIICGYARRTPIGPCDHFHFEVGATDIIRPQDWSNQPDPLYYITARYTRAIEQMVRLNPEQYFWLHRRWKSRPRHELQAKPMPQSLRRRLQELPWMDCAQLAQLESF